MSGAEIVTSLVQFAAVVAVTFGLLCLVTSLLRFQRMVELADAAGPDPRDAPTALRVQVARRLGTAHRDPEPFSVLLIRAEGEGPPGGDPLEEVGRRVRRGIRRLDALLRLDDRTLASVVGGGRAHGLEVAGRILEQFPPPAGIHVAVSSYPENGDRVETLLAAAADAAEPAEGPPIRTAGDAEAAPDARPRPTPDDPLAAAPAGQRKLLDPVTGLLLDTHLPGVLHKFVARCRKQGWPGSVLAVEIDHLDRYLDHYGPAGVDTLLAHVGCHLQLAVREDDLLARHRDNRLVVLMVAAPADALGAAGRIAAGIRDLDIACAGTRLKVTASIGVAGYPDHGAGPRRLLDHALTALEAARARGRDRCLLYEPGLRTPRRRPDADAPAF